MKPYITNNNILVTGSTLKYFKKVVFSVPYDGPKNLRRPFYGDIAKFLQHIICVATCSKKNKRKAAIKEGKKWSYSVPLPFELGRDKLPAAFKKKSELPHTRAQELLVAAKIIKVTAYSKHKCREFSISKPFLCKLFGNDREAYLSRDDRYHYLTDIFNKRKSYTFDELIGDAINRGQKVKHQLSKRDIPNEPFRKRVSEVWGNLEPLHINLTALLDYYRANPTVKRKLFIFNFLSHLAETGVTKVKDSPLIVSYRQSYKAAKIGGRSFEIGAGFQSLPSEMKWSCLGKGYNYDIKGCQLEILRHEMLNIGISDKSLKVLDTAYICRMLKVSEDLVKQFRFSSVFNAGYVSLSFKSKTVRLLNRELGKGEAVRVLQRWRKHLEPLREDLASLLDHYIELGKTNRHGTCVTNAVGQTFNITYQDVANGKRWRSDVMRRKLLSHMLQGLESKAVYDYVARHKGICALEHDGFVSYKEVDGWEHPYLRITLKHDDLNS
ncbi:TPA: hypothetical protein ACJCXE_003060 [Yersinia enterocolitica]|nr:hypothetical protein [Yersinia enterocolitica]HDL7742803.1 hypothetical protein [Yersinia enterocolitica]HDL8249813.1 hypothetical protein [Yersinia enterocolitica]HDM8283201.1 hypothetical protein [Yersinia enterocolitica]HEB2018042.1 hypothetical protein [Yersinia enterocolitica]